MALAGGSALRCFTALFGMPAKGQAGEEVVPPRLNHRNIWHVTLLQLYKNVA